MEHSVVQEVEIVIEKIQEIEHHAEIGEGITEINVDDVDGSEKSKIIIEEVDEPEIQQEVIVEENITVVIQIENKIQGDEIDSTEEINIFEAQTQMPSNISNETKDEEEIPLSMEVGYDFPNTGIEKLSVLAKLEEENLPSTNETDDIQITCGQVVKNSQEVEERKSADEKIGTPEVNGVNSPEKDSRNGVVPEGNNEIASKVPGNNDLTVEDMLADFVDEVKEDTQVTQA